MEVDEFDLTVEIFNQRSAAFHPVAAVQIFDALNGLGLRPVDVTADDAMSLVAARHGGESVLVFRDVFHGRLGLEFQIRRQRPVAEAERPAQAIEIQVEIENPVVKMRTELFQQVIEMRQAVRLMTVDDEIFFPVGGGVDGLPSDGHCAKFHAKKLFDEFVVVAADVDHLGLLAAFAEQLLDEHVVVLAPKPAELQFPAVNEIADEIEIFAINDAEKFQQLLHPRVPGAEVDVGNPNGAANERLIRAQIEMLLAVGHRSMTLPLCNIFKGDGNKLFTMSPKLHTVVT